MSIAIALVVLGVASTRDVPLPQVHDATSSSHVVASREAMRPARDAGPRAARVDAGPIAPVPIASLPPGEQREVPLPSGIHAPHESTSWEPLGRLPPATEALLWWQPTEPGVLQREWPEPHAACWRAIDSAGWWHPAPGQTFLLVPDRHALRIAVWRWVPPGRIARVFVSHEVWSFGISDVSIDVSCDGTEVRAYGTRIMGPYGDCPEDARVWLSWENDSLAARELGESARPCITY